VVDILYYLLKDIITQTVPDRLSLIDQHKLATRISEVIRQKYLIHPKQISNEKVAEEAVYKKAVALWGKNQLILAAEEASDLIKSICKHIRTPNHEILVQIGNDVADIEIMIAQLKLMFGLQFQKQIIDTRSKKIVCLQERIDREIGSDNISKSNKQISIPDKQ